MTNPLVSVVMPAYNCAAYIGEAITSALNQNIDLELIIVNDGSKDETSDVIHQFDHDSRVIYLENETNKGVAATRNKGVRAARGRYVAFLDSDDIWEENKLQYQIEVMENEKVPMCSTARVLMQADGSLTERVIHVDREITYSKLLKHNCINCSSVMIRTEIAREFPMVNDDSHEDYITWLKVLKKYGGARGLDKPLLRYRMTEGSKSGNKFQSAKKTFKVYRYLGYGLIRSGIFFISYMRHGVAKYYF